MGAQITIATHMLGDQRVGTIVDRKGLDENETLDEALAYGYVVGKKETVKAHVRGVLKALIDGVQKDGNGRKVDGYFTLQPYLKCRLDDVTDELDKSKASVRMTGRALKELAIDTSGWKYVVEGAMGSLVINTITTGETAGEIVLGEAISMNGEELGDYGATSSITWAVLDTEKTGSVPLSKVTADATRITLAADTLSELTGPTYEGKTIVFTVTIDGKRAIKSAVLRVAA